MARSESGIDYNRERGCCETYRGVYLKQHVCGRDCRLEFGVSIGANRVLKLETDAA
jgi:hypothetical protein